jgi:allantoicase
VLKLGAQGTVRRIEVDTNHFKGNFPESCLIEGCDDEGATVESLIAPSRRWEVLLPRTKLRAHTRHFFDQELRSAETFTHIRLSIFPDGGVSRLRLWGVPCFGAAERLARLNGLRRERAEGELLRACGSRRWAAEMAAARPFAGAEALLEAGDRIWRSLAVPDWEEAFAAHPRIGSKKDVAAQPAATRAMADGEQSGTRSATAGTMTALAEGNAEYERRFGHIYIVCATGKSADEMLEILRSRLSNDPAAELQVAAEEQRKITRIRLGKMLA